MFRRDYFMRQIEQMTVTLNKILFNKEHLPMVDAQQLLDEASRHLLGLHIRSLQALSSKDILELLTYQGNLDTGKALVLSDMFIGQGDMLKQHEQIDDAYHAYIKSLDLLLHIPLVEDIDPGDELNGEIALRIVKVWNDFNHGLCLRQRKDCFSLIMIRSAIMQRRRMCYFIAWRITPSIRWHSRKAFYFMNGCWLPKRKSCKLAISAGKKRPMDCAP
ncbi:hypothetical protein FU659_07555 [Paenibacillus sp. N3.4]|nr:DUF6483 family protein [Paenibacillus sp. N3.4]TXK84675.1 hypothetical protein FU659_07555 [Paenibacillus sp. N3.4]